MKTGQCQHGFCGLILALLVSLVSLIPAVSPRAESTSQPSQIDGFNFASNRPSFTVQLLRGHLQWFTRVSINGQEAGYFGIDTGSSGTVIDLTCAYRLKLPSLGFGMVNFIAGPQRYPA